MKITNKIINPEEIIQYVKSTISGVIAKALPKQMSKEQPISILRRKKRKRLPEASKCTAESEDPSTTAASTEENSPISGTPQQDRQLSQMSLAKFVIENNGVTHVPACNAYIVEGHNNKKYCVTLHPETCQCPSVSRCYHIIAVRMFVGLHVPMGNDNRKMNLRALSKRSLKRSDDKSGRKKPRVNDIDAIVNPAPDSVAKEVEKKTPKSKKKLRFNVTPDQKHLPAKKRKLDLSPVPIPWVGTLKQHHKEKKIFEGSCVFRYH
jgi:hypothetical protein